jgi:lipoprotein Spr
MIKNILFTATMLCLLGSMSPVEAQKNKKSDVRFLDGITIEVPATHESVSEPVIQKTSEPEFASKKMNAGPVSSEVEKAHALQFKYALLLDTEVEEVTNLQLFNAIDEWFGTRYQLGGSTKKGIDCSALVQTLFAVLYGINMPRTTKEQYKITRQISRVELKEGDLVFFNTRGGVSHVGIYLQNNKFVHAATSGGVMISDLYETYWVKRFIGVGRIDPQESLVSRP